MNGDLDPGQEQCHTGSNGSGYEIDLPGTLQVSGYRDYQATIIVEHDSDGTYTATIPANGPGFPVAVFAANNYGNQPMYGAEGRVTVGIENNGRSGYVRAQLTQTAGVIAPTPLLLQANWTCP